MAQIQFIKQKRKIYYVFNFFSIELDRLMDINTEKLPLITNLLFLLAIFLEFSLMQGFYKYPIIAATATILAMAVWSRYENYKRTYYTMSVNDYLYHLQYGFERDIYSYICVANTYVWYENGSRVLLEPGSYFTNPKIVKIETFGEYTYIAQVRRGKAKEFSEEIRRVRQNSLEGKVVGKPTKKR